VIDELQLSRDGTRAAMVIDGQADPGVGGADRGQGVRADLPAPAGGYGLGPSVVSVSWRTGDDMVVTRNDSANPVAYVNLDGVNSDGPGRNLLAPVGIVAANPSAVYLADARGVMQLSGSGAEDDQSWTDVRPFMPPARCQYCRDSAFSLLLR
jgi:hypothetical protein